MFSCFFAPQNSCVVLYKFYNIINRHGACVDIMVASQQKYSWFEILSVCQSICVAFACVDMGFQNLLKLNPTALKHALRSAGCSIAHSIQIQKVYALSEQSDAIKIYTNRTMSVWWKFCWKSQRFAFSGKFNSVLN